MIFRECACRSILSPSKIPGVEYAINPYVGCGHGCLYCYAVFMKRFTGHSEPWGQFVDVKVNGPQQLQRELRRARPGQILLSSVTDPYQPAEKRYGVTRACLEVLEQDRLSTTILTKSALVTRDLDLLKDMKTVDVGFTVTTLDEEVKTIFEPRSSPVRERFRAIRLLSDAGIKTWIFFGPVLPYFSDREETLDRLFAKAEESGADHVLIDRMNLYPEVWKRIQALLMVGYPDILAYYSRVKNEKKRYSEFLRQRVRKVARRHHIQCRTVF
ncbi:MAG: radical SAM protein [bacterium]